MLEPFYKETGHVPDGARQPVHVVLDNIRSAFNTGSVFRTSDAGAIEHLHLCGMTAHPPNPKLEKTALGAHTYVPWSYHARTVDALTELRTTGVPIVAIELTERAVDLFDFDWPRPAAIVFGNEVCGIGGEALALCDAHVRIPMHGHKNTINVATAYGIVLYELLRRWRRR